MKNWQEQIQQDQNQNSVQSGPVVPFSVGGFYTMKKRERQKALQQERESFSKTCKDLPSIPGAVYQELKIKQIKPGPNEKAQTVASSAKIDSSRT